MPHTGICIAAETPPRGSGRRNSPSAVAGEMAAARTSPQPGSSSFEQHRDDAILTKLRGVARLSDGLVPPARVDREAHLTACAQHRRSATRRAVRTWKRWEESCSRCAAKAAAGSVFLGLQCGWRRWREAITRLRLDTVALLERRALIHSAAYFAHIRRLRQGVRLLQQRANFVHAELRRCLRARCHDRFTATRRALARMVVRAARTRASALRPIKSFRRVRRSVEQWRRLASSRRSFRVTFASLSERTALRKWHAEGVRLEAVRSSLRASRARWSGRSRAAAFGALQAAQVRASQMLKHTELVRSFRLVGTLLRWRQVTATSLYLAPYSSAAAAHSVALARALTHWRSDCEGCRQTEEHLADATAFAVRGACYRWHWRARQLNAQRATLAARMATAAHAVIRRRLARAWEVWRHSALHVSPARRRVLLRWGLCALSRALMEATESHFRFDCAMWLQLRFGMRRWSRSSVSWRMARSAPLDFRTCPQADLTPPATVTLVLVRTRCANGG